MGSVNFVAVSGAVVSRDMRRVFSGPLSAREFSLPASSRVVEKSAFEMVCGPRGVSVVVCPSGLREISDNAFFCCESLQKIVFGGNSLLERIGEQAFSQSGLRKFVAPAALRVIGRAAFHLCRELRTVALDEALEKVGQKCFAGTQIESVRVQKLVRELPTDVFLDCVNLTTVEFAENSCLRRVGT